MGKSQHMLFFSRTLLFLLMLLTHFSVQAQHHFDKEEDTDTYFEVIDKARLQPVQERAVPDSVIRSLREDDAFWYANREFKKPEAKTQTTSPLFSLLQQAWLRNLLWFLMAGAFVAVLIWYLTSLDIQLFRGKSATIKQVQEEALPDDIFSIQYESEIEKAVKGNNYRLAVRLLYLQLLTRMADKGVIQYKQDRTNSEYLVQLYNTAYYKDFFRLTRNFEYTWYGQFAITAPAYDVIRDDFSNFNQRLHS
jgi:hypothetical protein